MENWWGAENIEGKKLKIENVKCKIYHREGGIN